ncbi:hypothetical protein INT45_011306 [Circinella minor]|uniref:OTU domain-containing protein n=1 Tax=Circinella minor TaxID=1195481 RepID=A0A8H7VDP4_9FUNG|nr:hypothetical protein INT45_011306 [Circinella minor]
MTGASVEGLLDNLKTLEESCPGYFQRGMEILSGMTCIPFCCPDILSRVDFSANLMVTDVTFGCFQDGFYLCTTTMFFQELGKYSVIYQAVLDGQSSTHFQAYFMALFRTFGMYDFVNTNGTSNFSGMVVDFSAAQRAGFIAAFEESFPLARVLARNLLKGCYFHYQQSVERVSKNGAVVIHERREEFIDYTYLLYTAMTIAVFQNTANMILREFPRVKNWINWWTQPMNAVMIFRSHEVLQPELQDHHIRTFNGTESFHRDLYRIVQTKQSILDTLPRIFSYLKNDAANFERIAKGFQINYNTTPRKTSRRKRKTVNDSRAPDVTSKLLGKKRRTVKKLRSTNSKNNNNNNNDNNNNRKDNNTDHDNSDNNDNNNSSNSNSNSMYNTDIIGHEDNNRSRMETDSDSDMDNEQLIKEAVQNKNKKIQDSEDDQEDSIIKEKRQIKERAKEVPNEGTAVEKKREEAKNRRNTLAKNVKLQETNSSSNINSQVVQDPEREKLFREIRLLPRSPDDLTRRLNFPSEAGVISGLYSPASDGNCGWRATAYNLYDDESAWKKIKEGMEVKLLQEIDYFNTIFGSQEVYELMEILKLRGDWNISSDNYFRLY